MANTKPLMYWVRHKTSKLEREMTPQSYNHLKRSYDLLGQLDDKGEVVPLGSPQQQTAQKVGRNVAGTKTPTIGAVAPNKGDEELLQDAEDDADQSEGEASGDTSADVQMTVTSGTEADEVTEETSSETIVDAPPAEEVNEAIEHTVAEETLQEEQPPQQQAKPEKKKTGSTKSSSRKRN